MQSLEAQGNVAEGLRVYEQLRTLLRDLGTIPSAEAIAVHKTLLRPPSQPEPSGRGAPPTHTEPASQPDPAPGRARSAVGAGDDRSRVRARGPRAVARRRRTRGRLGPSKGTSAAAQRRPRRRQDPAARRDREARARGRGAGACGPRSGGDAGRVPAVPRGARPLHRGGAARRAARDHAAARRRARTAGPGAASAAPGAAADRRGGLRDGALPAVRSRRRTARRPFGLELGADRDRRPALGRPSDADAAASPGSLAAAGPVVDRRRLPLDRAVERGLLGRDREPAPRAAAEADRARRPPRARCGAAGRAAGRPGAVGRLFARAVRRDGGEPVLHRGNAPSSPGLGRRGGERRGLRPAALRPARRRPRGDLAPAGQPRRAHRRGDERGMR